MPRTRITDPGQGRSSWMRPQLEEAGLRRYLDVLLERWWMVAVAVVIAVAAAGIYLAAADDVYEAQADLLVAPVPSDDTLLVSLGLIRQSSDATRDVETAARIASTTAVAARARDELGWKRSPDSVLADVTIEPVAQSNLITITARGSSPEEAADLANAFAEAVLEERDAVLEERIGSLLPGLQARYEEVGRGAAIGSGLRRDISRLEFLRTAGDPTLQLETPASPPSSPTSPRPTLTLAAALFVGLVLGVGGAFGAQAIDPRLRREEQLRSTYSLPMLARIPRERSRSHGRALLPGRMSRATLEAYRTLRANIARPPEESEGGQMILITGSAPREGKTTTALNLAAALALTGDRVILVEADLRRPALGEALGLKVRKGVIGTLVENVALEDALVTTPQFGPNLEFLLAESHGPSMSELFSLRAARRLLDETRKRADYVIFDSPPLTAVVDAMPLAHQVDDVVIVSRLSVTRLDRLRQLAELLAGNGIEPVGFVLVGAERAGSMEYYEPDERRSQPAAASAARAEADDGSARPRAVERSG